MPKLNHLGENLLHLYFNRVLLCVVGVSIVGFLLIKRRAIAKALVAHQEIRYERADSDDEGIGGIHSVSGKNRRNAF